nr:MAG TPA: hypothetical protein [Caudoviricetes sp.]
MMFSHYPGKAYQIRSLENWTPVDGSGQTLSTFREGGVLC